MSTRKKNATLYLRQSSDRQLPFGYEHSRGPKREMSIRLNPDQAKWMAQIVRWRAAGMSFEQIAKKLNRGKTRKHGSK
jgi:hypothetical protein